MTLEEAQQEATTVSKTTGKTISIVLEGKNYVVYTPDKLPPDSDIIQSFSITCCENEKPGK